MSLVLDPERTLEVKENPLGDGVLLLGLKPDRQVVGEHTFLKHRGDRHSKVVAARDLRRECEKLIRVLDQLLAHGQRVEHLEGLSNPYELQELMLGLQLLLRDTQSLVRLDLLRGGLATL